MSNGKRKAVLITRALLTFILAAVMIFALSLPAFKIGSYDVQLSEQFTESALIKYTRPTGEIEFGLSTYLDMVKYYKDIYTVMEIVALDSNMQYLTTEAVALYSKMSEENTEAENAAIKAEVDELVKEANEVSAELERASSALDEKRQLEIADLLQNNEDFCEALIVSYLLVEDYADLFVEVDRSEGNLRFPSDASKAAELIMFIAFGIALAMWFVILTVVYVIKLLAFVIRVIAKKGRDEAFERPIKFPCLSCAMTFFTIFLIWALVSSLEISMGLGLIIMLAIAVFGAFCNCIFGALLSEKTKLLDTVLNACVCLAAIALAVFLSLSFLKVDLIYDYKTANGDLVEIYEDSYKNELSKDEYTDKEKTEATDKALSKMNVKNTIIVFAVAAVLVIVSVSVIEYFIKQLENEGKERKEGKPSVSRSGIVICALLLVVSLIPSIIATSSTDTWYNKATDGKYKMLWNSQNYSDTVAGAKYKEYTTAYTSLLEKLEKLKLDIQNAEGEEREQLEESYKYGEEYLEIVQMKYARATVDKKATAGICIAAAAGLLVVQFVYTFIMHDDKKKKEIVLEDGTILLNSESDDEGSEIEVSADDAQTEEIVEVSAESEALPEKTDVLESSEEASGDNE